MFLFNSILTIHNNNCNNFVYADGDSEHISVEDMSKFVVLDEPKKKESKSQSKSSSAPAPKARPKRKATLKPRPTNTAGTGTAKDAKEKKQSHRTKRKSSGGDDDNDNDESPPLKKPAPKSTVTRRPKRTATTKKAPYPIKTKSGRIIKSTTVNIDGFAVKLGNNYEVGAESYEFQGTDAAAPPKKKKQAASKANGKTKAATKRTVSEAERTRNEHNTAVKEREEAAAVLRREFFSENILCLEKFIDPKMVKILKYMKKNDDEIASAGDGLDEVMQPDLLEGELRDYQLIGLNFIIRMFRRGMPMILGDEMGKFIAHVFQYTSILCLFNRICICVVWNHHHIESITAI